MPVNISHSGTVYQRLKREGSHHDAEEGRLTKLYRSERKKHETADESSTPPVETEGQSEPAAEESVVESTII